MLDEQKPPAISSQHELDDLLDLADVTGKRIISTRLRHNVTIREENATAALEVMSRFAANPKWLVYLPPTMSPSETSNCEGYLEYPEEAFGYFRSQGIQHVVCEQKHMGSRAVVVVCRDSATARARFGVEDEAGAIVTRTGRKFFNDAALETALLDRVRAALTTAIFWDEFATDWALLDCELMPWSAKAQELLRTQYAAVGAAANAALPAVLDTIRTSASRLQSNDSQKLTELLGDFEQRQQSAQRFVEAYRHYCWPVESIDDYKLAPFHLLATEGNVHVQQNHRWHMETLARLCEADPQLLLATPYRVVDATNLDEVAQAIAWWNELTKRGGEGMVVKPLYFIAQGNKGLIQPAVKCRGREYLRIIYGADYTTPANLARLRNRGLAAKRSLALREFALGVEGLERFIRREPLRRVHECVFGVLALESEPVDPRL